jgi:hypothetical protein
VADPKERPILFSAPMVRAILDGQKTQTRRVVKPAGRLVATSWSPLHPERGLRVTVRTGPRSTHTGPIGDHLDACPYGEPGDRLWVRETWARFPGNDPVYRATYDGRFGSGWKWKPSIHMPRWASRLTLEVTAVRVERLHDISESDAANEGISCSSGHRWGLAETGVEHNAPSHAFRSLWQNINGPGSWEANPWVWAVSFKRVEVTRG